MAEVPATHALTITDGEGEATIYSCMRHVAETQRRMKSPVVTITRVTKPGYGCKGCLDDWPAE